MPNTDLLLARALDEDRERGLDRRLEIKRVLQDTQTGSSRGGSRAMVWHVRRRVRTLSGHLLRRATAPADGTSRG